MTDLSVNRTLVKSPPELWSEVSEVESHARHLGEFGEIAISRLEPEHTVAWEGDNARGTVELEASGWGTKVTLSAALPEPFAVEEAPAVEGPPPARDDAGGTETERRESWLKRWFFRQRHALPEPEAPPTLEFETAHPEPLAWYEPDSDALRPDRARTVLETALDNLGSAHHRPFSRG
jgi:hypothetical protein